MIEKNTKRAVTTITEKEYDALKAHDERSVSYTLRKLIKQKLREIATTP